MTANDVQRTADENPWTLPDRGRVGIFGVIIAESAVFLIFVVAYLYYIGKSLSGPLPDVLETPIVAPIVLLSSSITITLAVRSLRQDKRTAFALWWGLTFALGAAFLAFTAIEWHRLIFDDGLTIATNLFGTTYYSLVGLHASHVIVGLLALGTVFALSLGGHDRAQHAERTEVLSYYWHFVDAVWVVVFTVVYVIGR
jgi:cytochrome c oxidase subunit 3/cytochrome o ubiquinol oxidase subunit 3